MTEEEIIDMLHGSDSNEEYTEEELDETEVFDKIEEYVEEQIETENQILETPMLFSSGKKAIDISIFDDVVNDHFIDSNSYTIDLNCTDYINGVNKVSFFVPSDKSEYIKVIDGKLYNFSSETIRLCSSTDGYIYGSYYEYIDVYPYMSESYYDSITQYYPYPYSYYGVESDVDGYYKSVEYNIFDRDNMSFSYGQSEMSSWPLSTIFLFIILLILLVQILFRKG